MKQEMSRREAGGFIRRLKSRAGQTVVEYLLATLMVTMGMVGAYGALGSGVKDAFQQVVNLITSETK